LLHFIVVKLGKQTALMIENALYQDKPL